MVSITVVSVLSLLCSMVQLVYICSMLWMLRMRQQKLRLSQTHMPSQTAKQIAAQTAAVVAPEQQNQIGPAVVAALGGTTPANPATVAGADGAMLSAHSMTYAGYYNEFLPNSFHSVPPAKGAAEDLHAAAGSGAFGNPAGGDSASVSLAADGSNHLRDASSPSDSALQAALGLDADVGRIPMPDSFGSQHAGTNGGANGGVIRGPAGATPHVASNHGAMYDEPEDDPFQARAAAAAGESGRDVPASASATATADATQVARQLTPAPTASTNGAAAPASGHNRGGSALLNNSTSSLRHSSILEGDESSMSLSTASRFRPKSSSAVAISPRNGRGSVASEGYSPMREDMQVSLDADDLSQPNQLVELVLDDELQQGGDDAASLPTMPGEGRAIRLQEASRSPQVRSDPTSMQTVRVLHISAAPFSQPEQHHHPLRSSSSHAHAGDSYSLMIDAPLGSSAHPHPHQQSRHIAHPKSLSYNRFEQEQHALHNALHNTDAFAAGGGGAGAASASSATSAPATPAAFGSTSPQQSASLAAQKRRASLTRKFGGSSAGGMPIPRPMTNKAPPHNPLDPNASPIRSKVKFLDSPRDRDRASMEALRAAGAGRNGVAGANGSSSSSSSSSLGFAPQSSTSPPPPPASDEKTALVPRERRKSGQNGSNGNGNGGGGGGGGGSGGQLKSILVPASQSNLDKHASSSSSSTSLAPFSNLLVLPVYYRFLVQQTIHCSLWTLACLVLLAFGTNLVQWGSTHPAASSTGSDSSASDGNPGWLFSSVLAFLLGVHAFVLDGILVFLSSRNVGRAAIKFTSWFAAIWGVINGVTVLVVSMTVHVANRTTDIHGRVVDDRLAPTHPFFVRSCFALSLNLFILCAPRWLLCDGRARRSNYGRKSIAEREAALARQQARWDLLADASIGGPTLEGMEDTFDTDPDAYDDETAPRNTWLILGFWNSLFHCLVLLTYALDFARVAHDDPLWATLLMVLLALGFVLCTPVLFLALQRDSTYWQTEWMNALRRMKASSELEEMDRVRREQQAIIAARNAGLEGEAQALEQLAKQPKAPSAYLSFHQSSESNFFIDYNVLEYGPLLGSGGFSSVYSARLVGGYNNNSNPPSSSSKRGSREKPGLDVAVKVLHVRDLTKEVVEQFLHEVGIVLQLNHPNIVHFLGVVFSPPDMVLVMEKCRRQSLLQLIKYEKIKFTEFQAVSVALAIADALRYIHEQDILHRDLKAANILFDKEGRPKLCDFGLSEERSKIDLSRVFCGTLAYMSPEVLRSETVGKASDVYSFSIILWELLHNELAWKRGKANGGGLNARVLVEMVAYRRARPPIKERVVEGLNSGLTAAAAIAAGSATRLPPNPSLGNASASSTATGVPPQTPLPADAARIDLQAFGGGGEVGGSTTTSSSSRSAAAAASAVANAENARAAAAAAGVSQSQPRPGLHPVLVALLREMWRDDYRRRPTFVQIVKRLTAFRELIRAQQSFK